MMSIFTAEEDAHTALSQSAIIIKFVQYLPLLQRDLALFLTADKRPVTPEHPVPGLDQMSKGCWEVTDPVLNYPLKKSNNKNTKTLKEYMEELNMT